MKVIIKKSVCVNHARLNACSSFFQVLIIMLLSFFSQPLDAQEKLKNKNYNLNLGAVILSPLRDNTIVEGQFPAIPLGERMNIRFDIINGNQRDYLVKFIHCSHDWYPSDLEEIEYLIEYNEFRITENEASFNTNTPYIHYTFHTPRLLISGNYVMKVFEETGEEDVIFTRRFIVYTKVVSIREKLRKGISRMGKAEKQAFDITIAYGNAGITNPRTELFAYIYKNLDWGNVQFLSKPQFIKAHSKTVEFSQYSEETSFYAGNEYRLFDIRSSQVRRENVGQLLNNGNIIIVKLAPIRLQEHLAYEEKVDLDGSFIVSTDVVDEDVNVSGDYFKTRFTIDVDKEDDGNIYLIGKLVEGLPRKLTQLHYNIHNATYSVSLLLKQGFYNYSIIREDSQGNRSNLDGDFFATQNVYDFFVYRRLSHKRYDEVVGYVRRDTRKK